MHTTLQNTWWSYEKMCQMEPLSPKSHHTYTQIQEDHLTWKPALRCKTPHRKDSINCLQNSYKNISRFSSLMYLYSGALAGTKYRHPCGPPSKHAYNYKCHGKYPHLYFCKKSIARTVKMFSHQGKFQPNPLQLYLLLKLWCAPHTVNSALFNSSCKDRFIWTNHHGLKVIALFKKIV